MFGGGAARRAGAAAARISSRRISAAAGGDVAAAMTITLPEAAKGVTQARAAADRQGRRGEDPGGPRRAASRSGSRARAWPAPGGTGDALITVTIAPHPVFTLEGADLRLELPVTLYEAVLGAKVRVPTLDGAVELTIPPGTSSGRTFRLKGKGFPGQGRPRRPARHRAIVLPESGDAELEALMTKWRERQAVRSAQGFGLSGGA